MLSPLRRNACTRPAYILWRFKCFTLSQDLTSYPVTGLEVPRLYPQ
jgi:hypothetical protein